MATVVYSSGTRGGVHGGGYPGYGVVGRGAYPGGVPWYGSGWVLHCTGHCTTAPLHCTCHCTTAPLYCTGHCTGSPLCTAPATVLVPTVYCTRHCVLYLPHCTVPATVYCTGHTVLYRSQWRCTRPSGGFPVPMEVTSLEVTTVSGISAVASHATSSRKNAESSRIDLADLSKSPPRRKYAFSSRAGVKFHGLFDLLRIVGFSENDRLKHGH